MHNLPSIGLIGAGRAGASLCRVLYQQGYPIRAVWSRAIDRARVLASDIEALLAPEPATVAASSDLVVLAVADDAIAALAARVAAAGGWRQGSAVVHLSGAHAAAILAPAAAAGAQVGALHPLQTFPSHHTPVPPGTAFAIEAAEPLRSRLHQLVTRLRGNAFDLAPADRPLYHAAAAIASNYTVALAAQATELLERCGLTPAESLTALLPLMQGTLDSLRQHGLPDALTGPIARGDTGTLRRHLEALTARAPDVLALYQVLAHATLRVAVARGLPPDRAEEIRRLL